MSALRELLAASQREARALEVELYTKEGRTRSYQRSTSGAGAPLERSALCEEVGWALRAGDSSRGLFFAATGAPRWPAAACWSSAPPRLPAPAEAAPLADHPALSQPLLTEREARALVADTEAALERECRHAAILHAALEDGESRATLESTRGVEGGERFRAATLRLVGSRPVPGGSRQAAASFTARGARSFDPAALARRLGELLRVAGAGAPLEVQRTGACVLAPEAVAPVLAMLARHLVGAAALRAWLATEPGAGAGTADEGLLGQPALTIVDDGRLPEGPLRAARDGEGVPTRQVVLVEGGRLRQPLLCWHEEPARASGCSLRFSWREPPRQSPSHFCLAPNAAVSVRDLLDELAHGLYLLAADWPQVDAAGGAFVLPVRGFIIAGGRQQGPVDGIALCGTLRGFCRAVRAVASDLRLAPPLSAADGCYAAPSVLLDELATHGLRLAPTGPHAGVW